MATDKRLMDTRTGRITVGTEPCVTCKHVLNDHAGGVPGSYLKCDKCDCGGYCDRASAWWLDEEEEDEP